MALLLTLALICAALTGVQSVSTIKRVSVKAGNTVHIPCRYEDSYKDNVKYLCRGIDWRYCTYQIKTNQNNSAKYSINDDKTQRFVTFTIKKLQSEDSDAYWCLVEITGTDPGDGFKLSVTTKGKSKLNVDSQWITGYFDDQVTIRFTYRGNGSLGSLKWCSFGGSCINTSGILKGAAVTTDRSVSGQFTVTMKGLRAQDIGWYWCSFGNVQMPVFLDVTVRPTTTAIATTTTLSTTEPTPPPSSTNEPGKKRFDRIIAPVVAFVAVSLGICFMLQRNMNETEEEMSFSEIVYSTVSKSPTSHQDSYPDIETEITYSSNSFKKHKAGKKVNVEEEDVVYSPLEYH